VTAAQRQAALARVEKLARQARNLVAEDHLGPPDWRPFIAELADEVALLWTLLLNPPVARTRAKRGK
jgi:hypothetical protein